MMPMRVQIIAEGHGYTVSLAVTGPATTEDGEQLIGFTLDDRPFYMPVEDFLNIMGLLKALRNWLIQRDVQITVETVEEEVVRLVEEALAANFGGTS